jgi:hypothetical protein
MFQMKPFSQPHEAGLKPRSAQIGRDQTMGCAIMLAIILNAIYRESIRSSLSGAKVTGA